MRLNALALVLGLTLASLPLGAHAMRVQPMQLEMTPLGRNSSGSISVVNTGSTKLPVEAVVSRRTIAANGEEIDAPADDSFLVFPPVAAIPPGATQVFRVQWLGDPGLRESEAYYVTIKQIPVQLNEDESGFQITYAFAVATHVTPEGAEPALVVRQATPTREGLKLTVSNNGNAYTYLSRALIRARGADGRSVDFDGEDVRKVMESPLLLPGSTREVTLPLDRPMQGPVQVDLKLRSLDEILN